MSISLLFPEKNNITETKSTTKTALKPKGGGKYHSFLPALDFDEFLLKAFDMLCFHVRCSPIKLITFSIATSFNIVSPAGSS